MTQPRLEDFGGRGTVSAQERLKQYQEDDKKLPKAKRALFWLTLREHDPEVFLLVAKKDVIGRRR